MSPKKNILILTCDYGFGHRSAANAIAKAMQLQHPQDSTTVIVKHQKIFREVKEA